MAYKQYGNVVNTLNIKAKNIFNWNTNYPDTYGYTNLNAVNKKRRMVFLLFSPILKKGERYKFIMKTNILV